MEEIENPRKALRYKIFSYALSLEANRDDRKRKLLTRIIQALDFPEDYYPTSTAEEDFEAEKYEIEHNINY